MRDAYSEGFNDGRNKEADQMDRVYAAARNMESALYDDIAQQAGIIEQQRTQIAGLVAALKEIDDIFQHRVSGHERDHDYLFGYTCGEMADIARGGLAETGQKT